VLVVPLVFKGMGHCPMRCYLAGECSMENYLNYAVAGLLLLSTGLLAMLIPGGPIENRNFSHISPWVLAIFNIFLTLLGIASLASAYFSVVGSGVAVISVICGISFFLVYALDLGKIFPISPDKMPRALFVIEVSGLILAIPLTLLSLLEMAMPNRGAATINMSATTIISVLVLMVVLGLGIVIFATKSAMRK
jgi:uncharacterized membrane protein